MSPGGDNNGDAFSPSLVVFDLDGTLIDSMPFVLRAFAHALAPFRPDLGVDDIFAKLGGPPQEFLRSTLGDETKVAQALHRLNSFGFDDGSVVQPFPGARELLERLAAARMPMAIWTGRDRRTTRLILEAHQFGGYFPTVVCGDDLGSHKPHPEGLVHILTSTGTTLRHVLYVGDADVDVIAGAATGVRTLLIKHGRDVAPAIMDKSWRLVGGPTDAYRLIEELCTSAKYTRD